MRFFGAKVGLPVDLVKLCAEASGICKPSSRY